MKSYIVITDKNYTRAFEIVASNIGIERIGESYREWDGSLHFQHYQNEIKLMTDKDAKEIEFDEKTMSQLARYNLEQTNKTLVSEIEYHENKLADVKREIDKFNSILEQIKVIAKDLIDGDKYVKVDEDEEEEEE